MIKIKLNNHPFEIQSISELTFSNFNRIMIKAKVSQLAEYLSLFSSLDVGELMESEFKGASIPTLYASIFDCDIKAILKTKFETFKYEGETVILKDIKISTYGRQYFFSLYYEQYKADKINIYELSLFCLAICLSSDQDGEDISKIYKELSLMNWRDVLPHSFFLLKKFLNRKSGSWKASIRYTMELSVIRWSGVFQMKKLISTEKKSLLKY